MTREEKITAGIVATVIILLIFWLRGSTGSSTVINENDGGSSYSFGGGGITIPSMDLPERRGPIIWPSMDHPDNSSPYVVNGKSTCACGTGTTQTYIDREKLVEAKAPPKQAPIVQRIVQAVRKTGMTMTMGTYIPKDGMINAATDRVWW